jgi:hypothetical protein
LASASLRAEAVPLGQLDTAPKLALVIGVDAYGKGWPKRQNSVRDAKLVGGELLRHGYRVAILENPNAQRLRRALKQFLLIDGDNAESRMLVWYSGHTHTIGGTSYLVPIDAPLPRRESEFTTTALPLDEYAGLLRRAPAAQVYTVIDAPVAAIEFDARHSGRPEGAPHLPVRQFLSSAAVGQAAADDGSFRRLFLRAVAGINRADANLDKVLTADEMGAYIANRVATLTKNRQTPLYGRLPGREYAGGDFAFRVGSSHRLDFLAAAQGRDRRDEVAEIEKVLWSSIEDSEDPRKFESFLKVYPDGAFAEQAFARMNEAKDVAKQPKPSLPVAVAAAPKAQPKPQPEPQSEAVAMAVAPPSRKPDVALPRDGVEMAQAGSNPFDAPIFPGLPILAIGPTPAAPSAAPPALPAATDVRKVTAVKPIPLEPGGEMAVPLMPVPSPMPAAAAPLPRPLPPSVPVLRPTPAAVPAVPAVPRASPPPATGGRMVQIGAFRERVVAERALAEWRAQVPNLFRPGTEPVIQFADLGARGTFYRVRLAGFGDSRAALDFCGAFKGSGRDCYVVPES